MNIKMPQQNINVTVVAEPSLLEWLALGVSFAMTLAAIVTARGVISNVRLTRKTARQQATLEFLDEYKNDKRIFEALQYIPELEGKKDIFPEFSDHPQAENVFALLNKYEILAVGLKHKIYDEKMFIETLAVETIASYEHCESLIMEMRELDYYPTSDPERKPFTGFEALAKEYRVRLALNF